MYFDWFIYTVDTVHIQNKNYIQTENLYLLVRHLASQKNIKWKLVQRKYTQKITEFCNFYTKWGESGIANKMQYKNLFNERYRIRRK